MEAKDLVHPKTGMSQDDRDTMKAGFIFLAVAPKRIAARAASGGQDEVEIAIEEFNSIIKSLRLRRTRKSPA